MKTRMESTFRVSLQGLGTSHKDLYSGRKPDTYKSGVGIEYIKEKLGMKESVQCLFEC